MVVLWRESDNKGVQLSVPGCSHTPLLRRSDTTTALLTELSQRIDAAKQDAQVQAQARRQHDEALASALAATQNSSGQPWQHDGMELDGQGDGTTAAKKK